MKHTYILTFDAQSLENYLAAKTLGLMLLELRLIIEGFTHEDLIYSGAEGRVYRYTKTS